MENKKSKKKPTDTIYGRVTSKPVETVKALVDDSNTVLSQRTPVWDRYRRKYRRGLNYLAGDSATGMIYFTNYIYSNVETIKAVLTKNLPFITVVPRGEKDDLAADVMSRVLTDVLEKGELKQATKGMVHNGLLSTMGYIKTSFNPEENKVCFESVLPDYVFVDPLSLTLKNPRWVIHKKPCVSVEEIYAIYGVVPETTKTKSTELSSLYDDDDLSGDTTSDNSKSLSKVGDTFDVFEAWIRCWDEDRENDWYIVTTAGETVLREEFSVYDHNNHPFDCWFCVEDESAENVYTRGVGAVEEIEPLQDRADSMDFKIMKHLNLMTNRQRYVSTQSGLNANTIDNTPGRVYMVQGDPSKTVYYDVPPALNQEIYNYRADTEPAMQTVSGVFDVMQGRRPTGITAGSAINSLKDSAETRTGCLSDSVSAVLQGIGSKTLSIIFQMYDDDMLLKASDADDDKAFVVVSDYPEELQPMGVPEVDEMGQFVVDDDGGFLYDESEEPEVDEQLLADRLAWKEQNAIALVLSDISYDWDVKIDTDSALPAVKAERSQVASDLFRLGAIDRQAVLDTMDFPNRRKILSRIQAEVTGKDAGDPNAEAGNGAVEMMLQQLQQILANQGAPPEVVEQIIMQLQSGGEQQGGYDPLQAVSDAQNGNGTFPPQMA